MVYAILRNALDEEYDATTEVKASSSEDAQRLARQDFAEEGVRVKIKKVRAQK